MKMSNLLIEDDEIYVALNVDGCKALVFEDLHMMLAITTLSGKSALSSFTPCINILPPV